MVQLAINASPFHCRWVATGSELRLEQWTYAICLRERNQMRVVSEDECGRCACWEPPTDGARHAHDDPRARRAASVSNDGLPLPSEGITHTHEH
jgi:hypothetical protein